MRRDFSKVITEKPRAGGRDGYAYHDLRSRRKKIAEDEVGYKEGMRYPYGYNKKTFTDLLGPLYRFLCSRVGKPWNSVHSEICENLKGRSTTQQHVLEHLDTAVVKNLYLENGKLYESDGREFISVTAGSLYKGFYVDPRNGLLKACKNIAWRKRYGYRTRPDGTYYFVNTNPKTRTEFEDKKGNIYKKYDGIWYFTWEDEAFVKVYNAAQIHYLKQKIERKKQLNRRELAENGLKNN